MDKGLIILISLIVSTLTFILVAKTSLDKVEAEICN